MSPKLLPLINTRHGSRSAKTCEYRCANQCDAPTPNTSGNEEFQTLAQRAIARRAMLTGSAGAMVLAGFGAQAAAAAGTAHGHHPRPERNVGRASFTSVAPNRKDDVVNAEGFTHDVIIRWGDPVTKRAPRFDVHHQTPEAQAQQFGYNNDYVGIIRAAKVLKPLAQAGLVEGDGHPDQSWPGGGVRRARGRGGGRRGRTGRRR
mgnify:CR=1 FL=1